MNNVFQLFFPFFYILLVQMNENIKWQILVFTQQTIKNNQIDKKSMHQFIDKLKIKDEIKKELKKISPHNYTGITPKS